MARDQVTGTGAGNKIDGYCGNDGKVRSQGRNVLGDKSNEPHSERSRRHGQDRQASACS